MATYAVDSNRQQMVATGNVAPLMAWVEGPDGRRAPSKDAQEHDELTKLPLWGVEVMYDAERFGKAITVTSEVVVGAKDAPSPQKYTPITFRELTVDAGVRKGGSFFESWRARELDQFTAVKPEHKPVTAKDAA